ncbi:MAG TPA: hypothetical protein VFU71_22600 [Burkholderiaceae bacterium]|nr:hypothetical protein [Burkholderiaceae bacterium]
MLMTHWRRAALSSLLPMCGCLTSEPTPVPPPDLRIMVTTRTEYASAAEAKIHASNLARVPIRDVEDLGAGRYRMVLACPDTATCRTAVQRIADDRFFALGVDAEFPGARQRVPVKPTREASR